MIICRQPALEMPSPGQDGPRRPPVKSIMAALVPPEASKFLASHPSKFSKPFTKALGNATVSCLLRLGSCPQLNQRQVYDEGLCAQTSRQVDLILLPCSGLHGTSQSFAGPGGLRSSLSPKEAGELAVSDARSSGVLRNCLRDVPGVTM